jgi:hypothetical protein
VMRWAFTSTTIRSALSRQRDKPGAKKNAEGAAAPDVILRRFP